MLPLLQNKRFLILLMILTLIYFCVLPEFWTAPKTQIALDNKSSLNKDLQLTITIKSWHPNFEIANVRFFPINEGSDAIINKPFYPFRLYHKGKKQSWSFWEVNRLSWPRTKSLVLYIPITDLARKNILGPGGLKGKIDITIRYPTVAGRARMPGMDFPTRSSTDQHPFEIQFIKA